MATFLQFYMYKDIPEELVLQNCVVRFQLRLHPQLISLAPLVDGVTWVHLFEEVIHRGCSNLHTK